MRPKAIDVKPFVEWDNGADICPDELYNNSVQKKTC